MSEKQQQKWIIKAKETYKFHRSKLLSTDDWTLNMTSKILKRSLGSISEDLLIAKWLKTHEKQLEKFEYMYEALEFIREKQKEQSLIEID
jgi:hypothetical protein